MVRDAETHADEDQLRRELAETRNQADNAAYAAERLLKESGDNIPEDAKSDLEGKIAAVRSTLETQDADAMKSALNDLNEAVQRAGQAAYSQQPPGGRAGGAVRRAARRHGGGEYREVDDRS